MITVQAYPTPQQFLDATESTLEQRELENNLQLGICNGFADKTQPQKGCIFINALEDGQILATAMNTAAKAIVSGTIKDPRYMSALSDYYRANEIDLTGAVGERFYAAAFSDAYGKPVVGEVNMIVHQLTTVNQLPPASGRMEVAEDADIELLTNWTIRFEEEVHVSPILPRATVLKSVQTRVNAGNFFKWVDKGEIVSIAAIVRKTKNIGIVGLVYTPDEWRGKGYATSCVQKLSERILQSGFAHCGLFTDKANPTSNHIYREIGYVPVTEFADLAYANE
ncbi:MAG: GNAT family N-acetyltransferase [Saprospiraceae bacterium]|nr:GNAT family N-acetyltransferase [Saprospiraceae bacterium]